MIEILFPHALACNFIVWVWLLLRIVLIGLRRDMRYHEPEIALTHDYRYELKGTTNMTSVPTFHTTYPNG